MLIIGAKGFAKEVLETVPLIGERDTVAFFDDMTENLPDRLYKQYLVLRSYSAVSTFFNEHGGEYTIGIGNPSLRAMMASKFDAVGGILKSTISSLATIGTHDVSIGNGCNILAGARISNGVALGRGCIVYYNVMVTHDCKIGDFAELSPGATLLGGCAVGAYTQVGANATVLPRVTIGENVLVGAGAVVTKDIPDNVIVKGVPAKVSGKMTKRYE